MPPPPTVPGSTTQIRVAMDLPVPLFTDPYAPRGPVPALLRASQSSGGWNDVNTFWHMPVAVLQVPLAVPI